MYFVEVKQKKRKFWKQFVRLKKMTYNWTNEIWFRNMMKQKIKSRVKFLEKGSNICFHNSRSAFLGEKRLIKNIFLIIEIFLIISI